MCTIMSLVHFILRDIASAIKNLLDAVNSVFMYIDGQSNKQVHQFHQTNLSYVFNVFLSVVNCISNIN